jgi:hypothetical protein
MKYRIVAILVLGVLALNLGGSTFADSKKKKSGLSVLVSLLPESDGVITFNVKRSLGEALPKLLAGNQPMLTKVSDKIENFRAATGIDVRQFDEAVVGVSVRQIAAKNYDADPVVIARGKMTSAALLAAAKDASNGKYREERVGERVMYVFDAEKAAAQTTVGSKVLGTMPEVGVAALDDTTLAFGDVERVRLTLGGKTRVATQLVVMLEKNPTAASAFAAKPPAGLKAFIPLDNDELGKNIDSIKYVYGAADVVGDSATIRVTAQTQQNAQATSLHETLEGLQMIGKAFLGGSKAADKQVYARLIGNAKFSVKANEVMFDLTVPQGDIDILVGMIK